MEDLNKLEFNKEDFNEEEILNEIKDIPNELVLSEEDIDALDNLNKNVLQNESLNEVPIDLFNELYVLVPFTEDEEKEVFIKLKNETDEKKRLEIENDILLHNMRLIMYYARKYVFYTKSLTLEDLVIEGVFGCKTAICKFDIDLGYKFSTYASWWIKQTLWRAIINTDSCIRIPVHMSEKYKKYQELPDEEKTDALLNNLANIANPISLNKKISSDNSSDDSQNDEIQDFIVDERNTPEEDFIKRDFNEYLKKELNNTIIKWACLKAKTDDVNDEKVKKYCDIVYRLYGLNGYEKQTLDTIGKEYHITRERVRQIASGSGQHCSFLSFARRQRNLREINRDLNS